MSYRISQSIHAPSYDVGDTNLRLAVGLKVILHVRLWVTSGSYSR